MGGMSERSIQWELFNVEMMKTLLLHNQETLTRCQVFCGWPQPSSFRKADAPFSGRPLSLWERPAELEFDYLM